MKEEMKAYIDSLLPELTALSDQIYDWHELGLEEFQSSAVLCSWLEEKGFTVERGVGSVPTSFRGVYQNKTGGPSIGLLCEYDALAKLGHACGHHLQGPSILAAAAAIKELIHDEPYRLVVYGTPAEETVSGKVIMMKNGCFTDMDVALMMHGGSETTVDIKSQAATKMDVHFKGMSAHAAIRPEQGRSALDAVLLMCQGIEFLREHLPDDVRIHYTILNAGGTAANIVPANATAQLYIRSYSSPRMQDAVRRFRKVVEGAALMTETEYEIDVLKVLDAKVPVYALNDVLLENIRQFDPEHLQPAREKTGCTDFGCIMRKMPGSCVRVAFVPPGTTAHSEAFLSYGKTPEAHRAIAVGAQVLSGVAADLIEKPDVLAGILQEFRATKAKDEAQ